ncbi:MULTISPECIES: F0F1 ATP synthase subunit gamma [Methylosinus]|uniref:H(+)-transporting ATPase n=1 Tax=Methylosinus trichosporium (strain ATCC 35070 / NCIMB 11131 / UNIQEM 75 / OB3b) TaxID=595536 RepID=A0A2D2CV70_METT3|nr:MULTISPECIES: FoF1 ATP synthase subunit gamma [Methylosinus]ATQ66549.1 H(+)-transporting ATPase [Methylosinus trichosporium OB3b]OBS52614.1 H(+)-transporting ATPase [Methylosinus sp. 3S-1]
MSERSADISAHIVATRQLESVITAMRGVAAIRTREAQSRLSGVRAYAGALGDAISAALALSAEAPPSRLGSERRTAGGHIVLAFCSERGFVGAFNERILEAAARFADGAERPAVFIIGERGATLAQERGSRADWTLPMPSRVDDAPSLADRIAQELYGRLGEGLADRVTLVHGAPGVAGIEIVARSLVPLDLARFPPASAAAPPLVMLPPRALVEGLAQEYVFAELCEAAVLSFAAENEARMRAMIEARDNAHKTLERLEARRRQTRQEEITEEIIELARPAPRRTRARRGEG